MDLFTNTPKTITPSNTALTVANNLRIASITLAAYDYLITIPSELRLYKSPKRRSLACLLFVLIRYSSLILLITANTGFFYHHFSSHVCAHYFQISLVLKVIQVMASQAILGVRAYFLSKRNTSIGITLLLVYIVVTGIQWFTNLYDRIPVMINGNCSTALAHPHNAFSTWTFYLSAMLFDFLALFISTFYLLKMKPSGFRESTATKLWRIFLFDGLGYFVVLTASNMMNLILFRFGSPTTGTSGASLGVSITWIMSQRIILHPLEARTQRVSAIVSQLQTDSSMKFCVEKQGNTTDQTIAESLTKVIVEIDNPTEFDVNVC